jgi:hypothetical protein
MKSNSISVPITDSSTPIPGVAGWTYGDVVEEMLDQGIEIDLEIYPFAEGWQKGVDTWNDSRNADVTSSPEIDDYEAQGWTTDSVLDAVKCIRAEERGIHRW